MYGRVEGADAWDPPSQAMACSGARKDVGQGKGKWWRGVRKSGHT